MFSWEIQIAVSLIQGNKYQKKNIFILMKQLNAQYFPCQLIDIYSTDLLTCVMDNPMLN